MTSKDLQRSCSREEGKACSLCGEFPCIWFQYEDDIVNMTNEWIGCSTTAEGRPPTNNLARKEGYKCFVRMHYGHLGAGNRQKIPGCVLGHIRGLYPDDNGTYMGFKEA